MKAAGKVIIVTGGGSGMGREIVLNLLARGARVAAVDISRENLDGTAELANKDADRLSTHTVDISDRAAVAELPDAVVAAHGTVDGLINNAGIIQPFVPFLELEDAAIERVLNINLYGTMYMMRAFAPLLLQRPEAHIVNISSMGGFFPFPGQTLYGASKAAIKLLSEGMYSELSDTNVGVTVVFPGAIDTNIAQNSGVDMGAASAEDSSFKALSPTEAARQIVEGMESKAFQVYVGKDSKALNILYRLNPKRSVKLIYKQMKKMLPDS